jgi:MFS family permease
MKPDPQLSVSSRRGLDWMNFFLADVRDGVGPYLAIFLLASHNWSAGDIGLVMGAMGVATGIMQIPAGQWMDSARSKRLLLAGACVVVGVACPLMALYPVMSVVLPAQIAIGAAAALILPGIAAITLGLVGHQHLSRRTGRNEVFNHAGNVVAALMAGAVGHFLDREYIFWVVSLWSVFSLLSILLIRPNEIDDAQARGATRDDRGQLQVGKLREVLKDRRILIFAAVVGLFHFGNAAMLPLVGQQLVISAAGQGASLWMSACIILAQLVMIPVARFAGDYVDRWGTRPLLLIGLCALPLRGVLYTLGDAPAYLLAVQMLDGIGAGIFGVVWVLVVADLTRGSGHYGVTLGLINAVHMVGFFLSQTTAGLIVDMTGSFSAGFLYLAAVAFAGLVLYAVAMPETRGPKAQAARG